MLSMFFCSSVLKKNTHLLCQFCPSALCIIPFALICFFVPRLWAERFPYEGCTARNRPPNSLEPKDEETDKAKRQNR